MFVFNAEDWLPKFILRDKNGYAIARAIEAGMRRMNSAIEKGLAVLTDYDAMPEWRLDELAWEYNCVYDFNAPIEAKRRWIKNAAPIYRLYGTLQAIYFYIGGYFDGVDVEENWQYGGEPYHFRVTVEGAWTEENVEWVKQAIARTKNVRSVLDGLRSGGRVDTGIQAEAEAVGRCPFPMPGPDKLAGQRPWPTVAYDGGLIQTAALAGASPAET